MNLSSIFKSYPFGWGYFQFSHWIVRTNGGNKKPTLMRELLTVYSFIILSFFQKKREYPAVFPDLFNE